MKKIISITTLLLAIILLVSCAASENEDIQNSENSVFVFTERHDGTLAVTKYNGTDTEVNIPAEKDGVRVTSVASFAFEGKSDILSVTLPDGITTVEACAFAGCSALAEIKLPESAVCLSKESFADTPWYASLGEGFVTVNGTVLEYRGDTSELNHLKIPDGVCRVGDRAFAGLAVKSAILPDSITSVGERAFYDCTSLMKITFPKGISDIGYAAFHNTAWYNMSKGAVTVGDVLVGYKAGGNTVTISNNVKTIASGAFLGCTAIAVNIPEGVERICDYAFSGFTQVVKISLPSTVTEIGEHAFELCPTLRSITVAEGNPKYSAKEGVLTDKNGANELFIPEGKPAPESEKYDPRDENLSLN